jgi:hypothetical protein
MKAYVGVIVLIHIFLTSALAGDDWSASRPGRFTPRDRAPGTHWIGGWVGSKAGLDDVEKRKFLTVRGLEHRPLGRPTHSQSLSRLLYSVLKHTKLQTTFCLLGYNAAYFGESQRTFRRNIPLSSGLKSKPGMKPE